MALTQERAKTRVAPTVTTPSAAPSAAPTLETRPRLIPGRAWVAGAFLLAPLVWLWLGYADLAASLPYAPVVAPEVLRGKIVMRNPPGEDVVLSESFKLEHLKPRLGDDGKPQFARGQMIMDTFEETRRSYPQGQLAAQVVGFTGRDGVGLYGLERFQNDTLASGKDVVLTLDPVIQASSEAALSSVVQEYKADWGTVVALEAGTNRVLALANYPTFETGNWRGGNEDEWRNRALRDQYDGGSTLKALTAAMLVNDGLATPTTRVQAGMSRRIPGVTINDVIQHPGNLTLMDVLRYSSNVGISTLGERLGKARLYEYLQRFGFGREVWPGDPSVTKSQLREPGGWRPADFATKTYGQGFTTTSLQLAAAFSVLVNDGKLIPPKLFEGQRVGGATQVISSDAAKTTRDMLEYTVRCGVKRAQVPGYAVGGKTGTAQTYSGGSISKTEFNALFVGYFPADKPKVTVLVQVWNPREGTHGSLVAAPAFQRIAQETLAHLRIAPTAQAKTSSQSTSSAAGADAPVPCSKR
jgi:cell division protein FtsI (penicillin-binding protein 3)